MISQLGYLKKVAADLLYTGFGHGHPEYADAITADALALQSHEALYIHSSHFVLEVPVAPVDTPLEALTVPFAIPITGYITELKPCSKTAASGSAASFAVSAALTWGGTPGAATTVTIEVGAFSGQQTTIVASEVIEGGMGLIAVTPDSGGTCKDARVLIKFSPGDIVPPAIIDTGRIVTFTWDYGTDTIDRFEILRDGYVVATIAPTARTAEIFCHWDSIYQLRACLADACSEVAVQQQAIFKPALAAGKVVTASSEQLSPSRPASAITDGRYSTFWKSAVGQAQWVEIDLGAVYTITEYRMRMGNPAYATDWITKVSLDGADYSVLNTVSNNTDPVVIKTGFSSPGRYIRHEFSASNDTTYVIGEAEVTGV